MTRFIVPWEDEHAEYLRRKDQFDKIIAFVVREGNVEDGEYVTQFERNFAHYCRRRHAVSVGSGSDAISLSLQAVGLSSGDEVITVANSGCPVPLAIIRGGGIPVFVDIEKETFNIDPAQVEEAITPRTRVIHAQHGYGIPCRIDALLQIAKAHNLFLMEDIAVAIGATYEGRRAGEWGDIVVCSFTAGKVIPSWAPGAGMVLTDSLKVANKTRALSNFGQRQLCNEDEIPEEFGLANRVCVELGANSRLGALQAGILDVKLRYYDDALNRRREIAAQYRELLKDLPVVLPPCQNAPHLLPAYRGYVIETAARNCVYERLRKRGIEVRVHYMPPVHLQPALAHLGYQYGDFPVAEGMARNMMSLPVYPEMEEAQVRSVVSKIRAALKECGS
jgi:dTDP-4-amino-4,6-dideoxygalactose transaminase